MRYLSVFLSGEYYISPFKYHFHTQRGPVSCSVFFFFFFLYPRSSLWNNSVSDEMTVCLLVFFLVFFISGAFWSGNANHEFLPTWGPWKRHEPKLWSAGMEPRMTGLNLNAAHIYCGLCGLTDGLVRKSSLFPPLFLSFCFSLRRCPEWRWFKLSDFLRPQILDLVTHI